ncbi:MAG: methyltransferase [Candidatus Omnitrophota bacterium]
MIQFFLKFLILLIVLDIAGFFLTYEFILILLSSVVLLMLWTLAVELNLVNAFFLIIKNKLGRPHQYPVVKYGNLEVSHTFNLNGGGLILAYEFAHLVSTKIGRVGHVFEYCAGPGFIGFNLLANNLCDRLTLSDVNPRAVETIKETIKRNHLEDRVTVYQSDCLDSIPEHEQWDLVVGNPPWDLIERPWKNFFNDIRVYDKKGRVHRDFFEKVGKFLKPGGTILFVEGGEYTTADSFKPMIEANHFKLTKTYPAPRLSEILSIKEYQDLRWNFALFLKLSLYLRQIYFIQIGKNCTQCPAFQPSDSIHH